MSAAPTIVNNQSAYSSTLVLIDYYILSYRIGFADFPASALSKNLAPVVDRTPSLLAIQACERSLSFPLLAVLANSHSPTSSSDHSKKLLVSTRVFSNLTLASVTKALNSPGKESLKDAESFLSP